MSIGRWWNIMVRQLVYDRLGKPLPKQSAGTDPLVVNLSARHCHLTQAAVEVLFGKGHQLPAATSVALSEVGNTRRKETLTLIVPRSRVTSNLRILGPCRNFNQS